MYRATNVLTCNSDIHHADVDAGDITRFSNGLFDSHYRLVDIDNNTFDNAFGLGLTHAKNLELTKLILTSDDSTDLRCADVENLLLFFRVP